MTGVRKIRGLYAVIDTTYVAPGDIEKTAVDLLEGGARLLQLRAKDFPGAGKLLEASRLLRRITSEYGAIFIVNDRVDVAAMSGADGVHLGADDIPPEEARRLLGPSAITGLSTHSLEEASLAGGRGVDYISFGPVFPTSTKKDAEPPKGLHALRAVKEKVRLPVVAIGGITEEVLPEVLKTGVDSIAVISEILLSDDIKRKTASLISRIKARTQ